MFKSLLFIGMLSLLTSFSQAEGTCEHWNEVVREVLANETYCVKVQKEGKIYLHPENIQLLEEGLYLNLNGLDVLSLSFIFQIERGILSLAKATLENLKSRYTVPNASFFMLGPLALLQVSKFEYGLWGSGQSPFCITFKQLFSNFAQSVCPKRSL